MAEVGDDCAACHVVRQQYEQLDEEQKAAWVACRAGRTCTKVADYAVADVKQAVVYPELACCYLCKLPIDRCDEEQDGEGVCTAEDRVTPVVMLALDAGWAGAVLATVSGQDMAYFTKEAEFFQWLGQGRRFHGTRGTNALVLWEALLCTAFL